MRQKGQFWRTGNAGLFTCSRTRGLHKLASYACLDSLVSPPIFSHSQPIATGDFVEWAAHVVNWMRVDGKLGGFAASVCRRGRRCAFAGGSVWTSLGHLVGETSLRHSVTTICVDRGQLFGRSCALLFGPSVLSIFMSTCFQAASK